MIVFVVKTQKNEEKNRNIGHLPPSVKLVYKTLELNGNLTQKDLISETTLPSRTVRYAIKRLKDEDLLIEKHYFIDARQSLYGLNLSPEEVIGT